jgi:hypothetical protein
MFRVAFDHGPNRRAQDRERAAAEAAARANRAEAERRAIVEAERIVAIWNARQAGGRAVVLPDNRRSHGSRAPLAELLLPGLRSVRVGRLAHARRASCQRDLKPYSLTVVSALFAQRAVCTPRNADGWLALSRCKKACGLPTPTAFDPVPHPCID